MIRIIIVARFVLVSGIIIYNNCFGEIMIVIVIIIVNLLYLIRLGLG